MDAVLTRRNTGAAEQAMRAACITWGRARWGDVRVIHELALGERRCDLAFVGVDDLRVVEIKGPQDKLSDGRLGAQMREYRVFVPEVWLFVSPKWLGHADVAGERNLLVPTERGVEIANQRFKTFWPKRDETSIMQLLNLMWVSELAVIAQRTDVIPGTAPTTEKAFKVRAMLARLLTGNEILRECCRCLRERPSHMTGFGSDPPTFAESAKKVIDGVPHAV